MKKTMRIAICRNWNAIEVHTRPVPEIDNVQILVNIRLCGICGTDIAAWNSSFEKKYPYSPGHEYCGVIEQIGARVQGLRVGERVVINPNLGCGNCEFCKNGRPNLCDFLKARPLKSNGGMAEYVALHQKMAYLLPESFPDELSPFIEPLSCARHACERAAALPGNKIVIFGAGIVGVLTAVACQSKGLLPLLVEPVSTRSEAVAAALNLRAMTPAQLDSSELAGNIDAAIDCSGSPRAVSQAIRTLKKGGRLVLEGLVQNDCAIPLTEVTRKEIEICGAWLNPGSFHDAIDVAVRNQSFLTTLTTKIFSLDNIARAFELASKGDVHKVMVKP